MKKNIILFFLIISSITVNAEIFEHRYDRCKYVFHSHNESSYQHAYCQAIGGIEEYENTDKTRVDCLTNRYAVEFDFANKWAESVGQAEYYALKTGKRGKVVLILEDSKKEFVYYDRVKKLSEIHNFDVEFITPEILNLKGGKCPYPDCKCYKNYHIKSL